MKPWSGKSVVLFVIGGILVVLGGIFCYHWPDVFHRILSKELPLTNTSRSFDLWKNTSNIPMNMEFYFFNWTNPEELGEAGKKPNFVELGPYTFNHKTEKVNITFNPENNTVSYGIRKFWYFDQKLSNGTLNDTIIQLNVVAISAAHKVRYWPYFMQSTVSLLLGSMKVYIIKTVDELLFTGFTDPLIDMAKDFGSEGPDDIPPFDKFGWFYKRNGTDIFEGFYNMATGEDNIEEIGVVKKWNRKDTTNFYQSPCNVIEGSAGEFWPPYRDESDITVFTPDLCRPVTYEYVGMKTHHGMTGYKYEIGEKTLGNNTRRQYPHETAKYFVSTTTTEEFFDEDHSNRTETNDSDFDTVNMGQCYCNGECSPMGVMNITACRYGAPGFVSLPHFHKADPVYRNAITGMHPNEEDHSFYFLLEPNTGIPIDVAARLQINILLQPYLSIQLFKDVPRILFPCFWFNMRAGVTEDLATSLRQLLWVPSIGLYSGVILILVGGIILLSVTFTQILRNRPYCGNCGGSQNTRSRKIGVSDKNKKTELVYMDTATNNDNNERNDRQLYPKMNEPDR